MKARISFSSSVALLLTLTLTALAQAPQAPQAAPPAASAAQTPQASPSTDAKPKRTYPAPQNLKVLPSNLTGEQVHDIMEKWEAELGAKCSTCHTPDPKNIGPNGRPRLNFVDDSKPEKETARKMLQMTDEINVKYVSKIDNSGAPVTCGTCHRGHLGPEPFVPKPDEHDHPAPPPATQK